MTDPAQSPALSLSAQLLHSTIRIECRKANGGVSSGTGFHFRFILKNSSLVPAIITNKHVFADAVECAIHMSLADEQGNSLNKHEKIVITGFTKETWIGHPDDGVDLAVLPIQQILLYMASRNWRPFYIDIPPDLIPSAEAFKKLSPLEDVTMIGYPNGIWDDVNNFPVVRRGITATGCYSDYRGRTDFLIDAAVFPGSSGSPVFIYNQGLYPTDGGMALGNRLLLIGILYAVHLHTAQGEIKIVTVPTGNAPMAFSQIPNNLGICVRSTRILDFQDILQKRADDESTSQSALGSAS
jgi:hypothetical protein